MYCLMLFMSRAALCDAAQYSDQASLNQATGSLLLASADCSLIVQVTCQEAILSSALLQHPLEHSWTQGMLLQSLAIMKRIFL